MAKVIALMAIAIAVGVALGLWLPSAGMERASAAEPVLAAAEQPATKPAAAATAPAAQAAPRPEMQGIRPMAPKQYPNPPAMTIDPAKKYVATIRTNLGEIQLELLPKIAPQHVNSFVFLAREHFYDGVIFHRVIPGFMIQGGDPTGTGMGGPGYKLPAEFNDTKHTRGVLSAARSADPNSAGSQFYIVHQDSPHLDRQYTAFGRVISGIEVVDKIAATPTGRMDRPLTPITIETITIAEQ